MGRKTEKKAGSPKDRVKGGRTPPQQQEASQSPPKASPVGVHRPVSGSCQQSPIARLERKERNSGGKRRKPSPVRNIDSPLAVRPKKHEKTEPSKVDSKPVEREDRADPEGLRTKDRQRPAETPQPRRPAGPNKEKKCRSPEPRRLKRSSKTKSWRRPRAPKVVREKRGLKLVWPDDVSREQRLAVLRDAFLEWAGAEQERLESAVTQSQGRDLEAPADGDKAQEAAVEASVPRDFCSVGVQARVSCEIGDTPEQLPGPATTAAVDTQPSWGIGASDHDGVGEEIQGQDGMADPIQGVCGGEGSEDQNQIQSHGGEGDQSYVSDRAASAGRVQISGHEGFEEEDQGDGSGSLSLSGVVGEPDVTSVQREPDAYVIQNVVEVEESSDSSEEELTSENDRLSPGLGNTVVVGEAVEGTQRGEAPPVPAERVIPDEEGAIEADLGPSPGKDEEAVLPTALSEPILGQLPSETQPIEEEWEPGPGTLLLQATD